MIDIKAEKESKLTPQEMYDIMGAAIQDAEDDGFLNSYVHERSLYLHAAKLFYPELKDTICGYMEQSPMIAWQHLLEDGVIEQMIDEYPSEINLLLENAKSWYEEYSASVHSIRGVLREFNLFSTSAMQDNLTRLAKAQADNQQILDIADKWGINNDSPLNYLGE